MTEATTESTSHWTPWRFASVEALIRGLEEYASFRGEAKVARFAPGGGESDELAGRYDCVLRQNKAIDRAMLRMSHLTPHLHRLLDAYYRAGFNYEAGGWERAMRRAGFPTGDGIQHRREALRATFDVLIDDAHVTLFYAHRVRRRRELDTNSGPGLH